MIIKIQLNNSFVEIQETGQKSANIEYHTDHIIKIINQSADALAKAKSKEPFIVSAKNDPLPAFCEHEWREVTSEADKKIGSKALFCNKCETMVVLNENQEKSTESNKPHNKTLY